MIRKNLPACFGRCLVQLVLLFVCLLPPVSLKADNRVVTVGVYENAPKIFTLGSGKPAGIYIDVLEHIARNEGWQLRYLPGGWGESLDRLERKEIDLMPDVAYTAERAQLYSFHAIPVLSSWFQVYAPKENNIHSLLDLNDKRILVLDRSVQEQAFVRLSQGFGLRTTLIAVPDYATMFAKVAKGEADAAVTNRFYGQMHAKKYHLEDTTVLFEPSDLFYAAAKGDPKHLLAAIDRQLAGLKKDPQSIYYASLKRWTAEEVQFQLPAWLHIAGAGVFGTLLVSLAVGMILKHQVNVRTRELQQENAERQMLQQRFMDIIEFLPDATFVIDQDKRVIAWNQACETMTGVKKEEIVGQDQYAYGEALFGVRRPILIDVLDQPETEIEATCSRIQRKDHRVYAESFCPNLRGGQGVHLWGIASPLYDQHGRCCGAIETVRDITEQKRMEEALRASEREYRQLVMLANSIILRWAPDGRITFLNEFGQRFFGYQASEILGQHIVGTLVSEKETDGLDLRRMIEEISADPQKFERNINENMRRNGERVWIDWTNKVVADAQGQNKEILSIGSDITERIQAEEQVRSLNEDLRRHAETLEQRVAERTAELAAISDEQRTIFESAGTGIVLLRNRVIVRCNRKLEEIAGYAPGELAGKSTRIWYLDDASFQAGGQMVYARLAAGETFRREQLMARKDGTQFWARLSLRAFDPKDPLMGAVGIVEDITDEREAAEKLHQALEAAQAADRIKSAFLATMSHELRTPLNSIIGFTGILLQGLAGPLNPEQHKQMGMVQKSSRHLLALINDVLDISKIEAGQFDLARASFALKPSIEKMVKLIVPLAEQKGIGLEVDIAPEVGTIVTDQRRLEQVTLNLLGNAVKFTENGRVRVGCRLEGNHYQLSFTDTGTGMQPEDIPGLFQPFHQIDSGLTRKHEGTGLGLTSCKKIVDLMGGSIDVASQWGQGRTFTVRLPRQPGETV